MGSRDIEQMKILFVDDEPELRESFKELIGMWTEHIYTASNGLEGIEVYEKHSPDIIITDIKMPVMDGLEMINKIKNTDPHIPVIILTAFEDTPYLLGAIKNKVNDYLVKPIRKKELKEKLSNISNTLLDKKALELKNKITNLYLDITDLLIVALDTRGNILMINRSGCEILGLNEKEVTGKNWFEIGVVPDSKKEELKKYFSSLIDQKEYIKQDSHTNELIDLKGNIHQFIWLNIILKEKDQVLGVLSSAINLESIDTLVDDTFISKKRLLDEIEKRKEVEKVLINQSKSAAMGEMISLIAHQWRQPLSIISMDANNILADIEFDTFDEDNLRENVNGILYQTLELSNTIDDFKNFFKASKNIEDTDFEQIYEKTNKIVGKSLLNNDIKITKKLNSTKKFETYSRELIQVLINIIKNAKDILIQKEIKNKNITITTNDTKEGIHITICDNAGGVPEEIKDSIFKKYFTTKDKFDGTGLGLYISKLIIEEHLKGKIIVQNNNDGACFHISLPFKLN